jgi:aspartyl aminopeptidase
MEEKTTGQQLQEQLVLKYRNAWEVSSGEETGKAFEFCESYKEFLNKVKTEREFVREVERLAQEKGFVSMDSVLRNREKLLPGRKLYQINRNKAMILCVTGSRSYGEGIQMIGVHSDSPRLDLKQNPVYEDTGMVLLKTHYYGGFKKYQWVTIPLALHGVVIKRNGEAVEVSIGEEVGEPVFTVSDLLPHLAQDQVQKKAAEVISGEGLNILFGSLPYNDDKVKDKVKLNILRLLHEKYGMVEEDFVSAELEAVPADKARDVGLDRSMIGAYGQDDRACAYTAVKAILEMEQPEKTALCVITDKEEIGSMGNTGAQSRFLENFVVALCSYSEDNTSSLLRRECLTNSRMLSADVVPAVDPNYEGVQDKRNAAYLGKGVYLNKYGGVKGKAGTNDANAEYVGSVRKLLNEQNIIWHAGEFGKVDQGGGGTIAEYTANLGMEVMDCGLAVLSIHSPFEVASKIDVYMSYKAYKAFYSWGG